MSIGDIIGAVSESLPPYNDYLLKDFRENEMGRIVDKVSDIFTEAIRLFHGTIKYLGYRILSPEERAIYETTPRQSRNKGVDIDRTSYILVEYQFQFEGITYPVKIYLPYLVDYYILYKGVKYTLMYTMMEKIFSRTEYGLVIKFLRSPVHFNRVLVPTVQSVVNPDVGYRLPVITAGIYQKRRRSSSKVKSMSPTIVHYFLCMYGFKKTMELLGIEGTMSFSDTIGDDTAEYEYLYARKKSTKENIFLKVKRDRLGEPMVIKTAITLSHLLQTFTMHSVRDLEEEDGTIYRVYLGKITHGSTTTEPRAKGYADQHLSSMMSYLDPYTRDRLLKSEGVDVKDIMDLLLYMYRNIEDVLANTRQSDMSNARVDLLDGLLNGLTSRIYMTFYDGEKKHQSLRPKDVKSMLDKIPAYIVKPNDVVNIISSSPIYSDNYLTTILRRIRTKNSSAALTSPSNRFDPSVAYVTSIMEISEQNPGATGQINPYLEIAKDGSIVVPDYAKEFDKKLQPFLPFR